MLLSIAGSLTDHTLQASRAGHQPQIAAAFSRSPGRLLVHISGRRLRTHSPVDSTRLGTGGSGAGVGLRAVDMRGQTRAVRASRSANTSIAGRSLMSAARSWYSR